ncbi:MAG TPA: hypothetical protein VKZ18_11685 [Polyangia bacterium]|nr:hypothetical protein [Polyangia bacterium]
MVVVLPLALVLLVGLVTLGWFGNRPPWLRWLARTGVVVVVACLTLVAAALLHDR